MADVPYPLAVCSLPRLEAKRRKESSLMFDEIAGGIFISVVGICGLILIFFGVEPLIPFFMLIGWAVVGMMWFAIIGILVLLVISGVYSIVSGIKKMKCDRDRARPKTRPVELR